MRKTLSNLKPQLWLAKHHITYITWCRKIFLSNKNDVICCDKILILVLCISCRASEPERQKTLICTKKWGFRRFQKERQKCIKTALFCALFYTFFAQKVRFCALFWRSFWNRRKPHFFVQINVFLPFGLWGSTGKYTIPVAFFRAFFLIEKLKIILTTPTPHICKKYAPKNMPYNGGLSGIKVG